MLSALMQNYRWRHVKTDTFYRIVGECRLEANNQPGVLYQREAFADEAPGPVWARSLEEFMDGRFEMVPMNTAVDWKNELFDQENFELVLEDNSDTFKWNVRLVNVGFGGPPPRNVITVRTHGEQPDQSVNPRAERLNDAIQYALHLESIDWLREWNEGSPDEMHELEEWVRHGRPITHPPKARQVIAERRDTFTVPHGWEAERDDKGRTTGYLINKLNGSRCHHADFNVLR